ncbi:DNA-processing protein DprA [Actinomadura sp. KC06]|uniref:DNA-processing protein DprA n=1 Tax=Actinomadura sp. KC06 TaxID=2530369 RepID=UPI001050E2DB|nr:DNA-processing protein DprA [Actinomadura sp. KC06]TDD27018.1 DNA-processing protein DprA [Actinomadura sp. KC06]
MSLAEQAAVLALVKASARDWHRTANLIAECGSAERIIDGETGLVSRDQQDVVDEIRARLEPGDVERARQLIDRVTAGGVRLVTVLDVAYPVNLQMIYNRPPFIWVRGHLDPRDLKAVAVVGTRQASKEGRENAAALASGLAEAGVCVVSGLARGIDTAAHTATLDAGGRTVAVICTGILSPTYPTENADLARRIVSGGGAVVSQFWPEAPPRRTNFPLRNVVMSGLAAGTIVVEASATSGAKMQARIALEHGKRLFLPERLLEDQEWAQRYANRPGVTVVRALDDVLEAVVKAHHALRERHPDTPRPEGVQARSVASGRRQVLHPDRRDAFAVRRQP